jgi:hypothetical protein
MREECRAAICGVLAGRNVKELKRLFNLARRKPPFGELLGIIDAGAFPDCSGCAFRFSWADTSYCNNQYLMLQLLSEDLELSRPPRR